MAVVFQGSQAQLADVSNLLLATIDVNVALSALSSAGFTNCSINADGNVFNRATGTFLTQAQLVALIPFLPHVSGSTQ